MRFSLEKLPEPFQTKLRRLILRVRIPINQIRGISTLHLRRMYRWWTSDSVVWREVNLGGADVRCFCISLLGDSRFEERREVFQKHAVKFGWSVDFWPAINGRGFLGKGCPKWIKSGRKAGSDESFGAGAIGLLMTVREIYEWSWEQDDFDTLVIFEDDAVIHSCPRVELPEVFDIVFFNNRMQGDRSGLVKSGWGTDGYVISRRGIQKMLEILQFATAEIDLLMMMHVRSAEQHGYYMTKYRDPKMPQLDCYQVGPLVTHASFFTSSIGIVNKEGSCLGF